MKRDESKPDAEETKVVRAVRPVARRPRQNKGGRPRRVAASSTAEPSDPPPRKRVPAVPPEPAPKAPEPLHDVMTMADLMVALKCGKTTLYRLRKSGNFPPVTYLRPDLPVVLRTDFTKWLRDMADASRAQAEADTEAA